MSMDAGAAGAFGLYLPEFAELEGLYKELQDYVTLVRAGESEEDPERDPHDFNQIPNYRDRFLEAFDEKCKITVLSFTLALSWCLIIIRPVCRYADLFMSTQWFGHTPGRQNSFRFAA